MRKIAIKRLTASDLTFFESQFRTAIVGGNQKAINLNADVFIRTLFPALPEVAIEHGGTFSIDLWIYGPGKAQPLNLQRKVTKQGTYKNWRLNGEFVADPHEEPGRFVDLKPGDIAVIEFLGTVYPSAMKLVLLSAGSQTDNSIHSLLDAHLGQPSMISIDAASLDRLIDASGVPDTHQIQELTLEADLEDALQGGLQGQRRIRRKVLRKISKDELAEARRNLDAIGRQGEEIVDGYLRGLANQALIQQYEWISAESAFAPYDFTVTDAAGETVSLDVKCTATDFNNPIHLSLAELTEMAGSSRRYDLYRVFDVSRESARLRIALDLKSFAKSVLSALGTLPTGVQIDGISVKPASLPFGGEQVLTASPVVDADADTPSQP